MSLSKELLNWRKKQPTGAIMKPETFRQIEKEAEAKGIPKKNAVKVAGKAYWNTVKAKYQKRRSK